MTAHAAKGLEWDVVVVAGVQEGSWPDLRGRGSLLGSQQLVDVLAAVDDDGDVARCSRSPPDWPKNGGCSTSRSPGLALNLLVTAVRSDDQQPSRFLDELVPSERDERPFTRVPRGLDLAVRRRRTARRRHDPGRRRAGEPGRKAAAAANWPDLRRRECAVPIRAIGTALRPLSDDRQLVDDDELVRISPSSLKLFGCCPLRWLLESSGGTSRHIDVARPRHVGARARAAGSRTKVSTPSSCSSGWPADDRAARSGVGLVRRPGNASAQSRWCASSASGCARIHGRSSRPRPAFDVTIGRAGSKGQVDRLERDDDGRLVVVDLKTGKGQPTKDEMPANAQLGAYQLAVEAGRVRRGRRRRRDVGRCASSCSSVDDAKARPSNEQEAVVRKRRPAAGRSRWSSGRPKAWPGSIFAAIDNDMCRSCPVRTSCPVRDEGRQVTA